MVKKTKRTPVRQNYTLRIQELRTKRELTQLEFSKKCGIKKLSVAAYENGYNDPSLQALVQMAVALECTLDELVNFNREAITAIITGVAPTVDKPAGELVTFEISAQAPESPGEKPSGGEPEGNP